MPTDPDGEYDGGYTPDFLAFKHGLTLKQARELIERFGPSRKALDAAALRLKQSQAPFDDD